MSRKPINDAPQTSKSSVKRRAATSGNAPGAPASPFQEQDAQRRLGNFTGKGEAPRKGSRGAGIVGQKKQKFKND
jgi:hypothetical protein